MDNLEKKEFCIIGVENIEGLKDDVISMSTGVHKIIEANNMIVITFDAFMTPLEMKGVIEEIEDRTYFLFELNHANAAVRINKKDVNDYLFSSMKLNNPLDIISTKFGHIGINNLKDEDGNPVNQGLFSRVVDNEDKINDILETIRSRVRKNNSNASGLKIWPKYTEDELNSYTKEEQDELVNELLDKAPNLTEEDKKILDFLVNKKN
jgi:hypothetical protein